MICSDISVDLKAQERIRLALADQDPVAYFRACDDFGRDPQDVEDRELYRVGYIMASVEDSLARLQESFNETLDERPKVPTPYRAETTQPDQVIEPSDAYGDLFGGAPEVQSRVNRNFRERP